VWREVPRKRKIIRKLLLAGVAAASLFWLFSSHNAVYIPVTLSPVVTKDVPVYIESVATVQANQTVTVHAQMDGQLSEVLFKEGQEVKQGAVLAKIDPRNLKTQYDEAVANKLQDEAMLAQAKNELAKLKIAPRKQPSAKGKPADSKDNSRKLDEKRNIVRQFEATVQSDIVTIETLKNQLSRSVIVSPIDGRAGIRQVDAGNMVHSADMNGLVVITQLEPISVIFDMPEKNLRVISERLNNKEVIKALAMDVENKNVLDEGTLELVDNQVDAATGMIHLKATFPNHRRVLWPGGTVHVRLLVSSLKDAVVVPAAALHKQEPKVGESVDADAKPWVFVYDPKSQSVEKRVVNVSINQDGGAVIEKGLKAGETVVTDSMGLLVDGSYVTSQNSKQ
jgi:multidrug efflux system membrane fusion protein